MSQYSVFYGEYENEKKNGTKKFNLFQWGFEPRILNKFTPTICILREIRSIEVTILKKS